jgi:alpha-tubulin suppressor-like RCC1 family protein
LVKLPGGVTFTAIAAGLHSDLALDSTGHSWSWGESFNQSGQLGTGDRSARTPDPVAVKMPPGVSFTAIAVGALHSLAIDGVGHAWAWGQGRGGQLGNGGRQETSIPVAVTMPQGVAFAAIAANLTGDLALDRNGNAWTWGTGAGPLLGNGTTTSSDVPVAVKMPQGITFTAIAAGSEHDIALDSSGHAWSWGYNGLGQLGDARDLKLLGPGSQSAPGPVRMPPGVTFAKIAAGGDNSLALDTSGHAWAWGDGCCGALGNGAKTEAGASSPVAVSMPAGTTFIAIAVGQGYCLGLDRDGHAWGWGVNSGGQLGVRVSGLADYRLTPVAVGGGSTARFTSISAGGGSSLALSAPSS